MRRASCLLLVLLWSVALRAVDTGPADMSLVGPDAAQTGESVRLRLDGLPTVDLSRTMQEQLSWLSQVRILTAAPRGVAASEYDLDQQLSIKVSPFQWTFTLDFLARRPGDYLVIVDWNEAPYGLVFHRITVGGTGPTPKPPDPTPPPPQTATGALILFEDDETTPSQAVTLNKARNDPGLQTKVLILDQDAQGTDEQPLPLVTKARAHIGQRPLPVVIARSAGDSLGVVVELPGTAEELIALLKSWGVLP